MEQMKESEVFEHRFQVSASPLMATTAHGQDGGRPPSSLSAPASTCHSPLAAAPAENGFRIPAVQAAAAAATTNDSASSRSRKRSTTFARFRQQVRTMKEKLNVKRGRGRSEKMLRELFGVGEEERLLEACECSLSTTAGPIAGHLFISTHKLAFCSQTSIALHSSTHGTITTPYKVCIPLNKIREANQPDNATNPPHKFLTIVTHDNYEFWFMLSLASKQPTFIALQKALSNSLST